MLHCIKIILFIFLLLVSTSSGENIFKNKSRNNLNKVNDPFESLIVEMKKYVKDCKLDHSSEEFKERHDGSNSNNHNKRSRRNSKEIDDDDASFSSRQYYLTKANKFTNLLDNKNLNNNNYTTQQENTSAYGRNWNTGGSNDYKYNNFGENFLRNGNNENSNRNNRGNSCNNDQNYKRNNPNNNNNNYGRNSPDGGGNGYSGQNNGPNNYNRNGYSGQNYNNNNRRSDGMDRGYSSNMETVLEPSSSLVPNRNYKPYQNQPTRTYGTVSYPVESPYTDSNNKRQYDNENRRSSEGYYIIRANTGYSNGNRDFMRNDEYTAGLQPQQQQSVMVRKREGRYPRSSGNINDWNKSEENVECIARCIFGYLDVIDEDKTPTEVALIKWLQDHESNSNNRIKALRKVRRCFARLSTSDIEESCEFSRTLCRCLEIDIKNLTNT